jgi:PAS domain-containing protein
LIQNPIQFGQSECKKYIIKTVICGALSQFLRCFFGFGNILAFLWVTPATRSMQEASLMRNFLDPTVFTTTKKLSKPRSDKGIPVYAASKELVGLVLKLSKTVSAQQQEIEQLKDRARQAEADLEGITEKERVARSRLGSALALFEDGIAVFDHEGRLVAANPTWFGPFDGVMDVAPGATYEAILRIAVEEGLIDLQSAKADEWVAGMIARWGENPISPKDIRLFNGTHVRVIDRRNPQGDIVSLCINVTNSISRQNDPAETAAPVHAFDDELQADPDLNELIHLIDAGETCQTIEAPFRERLALAEINAVGQPTTPVVSNDKEKDAKLGTASALDISSGNSERMFAADRGQMRHVAIRPRKANISNLIAAIDRRRAKQERSDNVSRECAKSALAYKDLMNLALMSAIKPTSLQQSSATYVKPLMLLPEQRVEDVARFCDSNSGKHPPHF